jgi:hypothetical protein
LIPWQSSEGIKPARAVRPWEIIPSIVEVPLLEGLFSAVCDDQSNVRAAAAWHAF